MAYLLGLEGIALLRSFTGEHDRVFVDSRIAEIRRLLDNESLANAAVEVARVDTTEGYRIWPQTYDTTPNTAFNFDQPVVTEIIDTLLAGVALDAACGTGRYAAALAERGHRILGVDSSPDMLAHARTRVPQGFPARRAAPAPGGRQRRGPGRLCAGADACACTRARS